MSVPSKRRRWFRFSLRTMFVLFTVVAVWLGWNVHAVRERRSVLGQFTKRDAVQLPIQFLSPPTPAVIEKAERNLISLYGLYTFGKKPFTQHPRTAPLRLSMLRQWPGDEPRWLIAYNPGPEPKLIRRLFPEAIVLVPATANK